MKIGLLCIFIGCSWAVRAQDLSLKILLDSAYSQFYLDFDRTDELVKQGERIATVRTSSGNLTDLINLYNTRIQSCNAFSRFQLWRQYVSELQEFLEANKKVIRPDEYQFFALRNNLSQAQFYAEIGDNTDALELFLRLQSELKRLPQSADVCDMLRISTSNIADIHQRNGEYEAAVNQFLASIGYLDCIGSPFYALDYRNVGEAYLAKRDFKQAGKYLKLAEDSLQRILKKNPAEVARTALSLYETEASYYERMGSDDSAMLSMEKAVPLLKLRSVDDSFKGRINLSLGNLYIRTEKLNLAQTNLDQAERYFLNSQEDQPAHLSSVYLAQADLLSREGKMGDALKYCDKAFERLVLNFRRDADGNPELVGLFSKKQTYEVLKKKSQLLEGLFSERNDIKILTSAANTNKLALALLDSTASEISLDKDKVILAEESYSTFEAGIRMAYKLYIQSGDKTYLDDCFNLMDKGKGIVLLENLRAVNRFSGVNTEWLSKEKEIKSELLITEQNLYKLENLKKNQSELFASRERYAKLKSDYASLINKVKIEAPDYYHIRFDHTVVTAEEVQRRSLRTGEGMIEYFVGDSILAIVGLSNKGRYIGVKRISRAFIEKVNEFRKTLIAVDGVKEGPLFTKLSSDLYALLVHDAISELGPDVNSLTIIPDGVLGYIPFEVFRLAGEQHKYLGDKYAIRYAYSATYLREQMQKKTSGAKYFFAGFASSAVRVDNRNLAALPGAEKEIAGITELLGSGCSIFNPASKRDFKNNASDFRILHLAMHSLVNNENPMFSVLVFSPSAGDSSDNRLLTALELYNMNLNSDLAVLSACNTGFGSLSRGEGIMSFARAFAYAGVQSAVISLWQVPDKATSRIMVNFYKYLKAGESKDRALQQAKLDFVRDYPQMSAPFYWAGFILTGSKEPLRFPSSRLSYWIIVGLLIAEFFLVAVRRKMSSKQ